VSSTQLEEIRKAAEADLLTFIKLIAPQRVLGAVHEELIRWWTRPEAKDHQLVLLPRDHGKSAYVAYRVVWELTKDPSLRVLYMSATSDLAQKQLGFMKSIFTSETYRRYWPQHVQPRLGMQNRKWSATEIELDHPIRKEEQIRDPSIKTAGLTTGITGLHFDIAVLDDVVVYENAYTGEGRKKVETQYSLLASIEGTGSREWIVGTRYHPKDLYGILQEMQEPVFSDEGEYQCDESIYEIFERQVESTGDGFGEFLWPKQKRKDGKWFGFDVKELARKKAKYLDRTQFRAQYYNDPSDPDSRPVDYDKFQYYERSLLKEDNGHWTYNGNRLNLMASIDFAYSVRKRADFTAIVVAGVDHMNRVYVLDINRFKTSDISEYFKNVQASVSKWGYRKLRAEVTAAQKAIVQSLKYDYILPYGLNLAVEEVKPTRHQGSKEERIEAILVPRYDNLQVYHYKGGNCQILEEELVTNNPPHDDVKDALATAVEGLIKPQQSFRRHRPDNIVYNTRFGGRV
jgi:phage terminase large subunit-like protein